MGSDSRAFQAISAMGIAGGAALTLGVLPEPALGIAWACYRSLCSAGQGFLGIHWGVLLLEAGLMCLPLALCEADWPGKIGRRPTKAAVWLDWQFWFGGLRTCAHPGKRWFLALEERLLQGSEPVLALFGDSPFPDGHPRHIRTPTYRFRFATPEERDTEGRWWSGSFAGGFCPVAKAPSSFLSPLPSAGSEPRAKRRP